MRRILVFLLAGAFLLIPATSWSNDDTEFKVNTYTTSTQGLSSIAMDAAGNFVIAWSSQGQDGNGRGIFAQRYDSAGNPVGGEFQVNTYTTNHQTGPSIAMNAAGNFVIAWESLGQDGDVYGVYAQRYNSDGTLAGSEIHVNTYTTSSQGHVSAAMDADGNFVIAWESLGQDGSYTGIYAQRYNSDGTTEGSEFQVNTFTTDIQDWPSVAMDADGDFVIAWESQALEHGGIFAQRYDSAGNPVGGEFQVNTYTTESIQRNPSVAMNASGNLVIAWDSWGQDGDSQGIFAQRYNSDGTLAGSEFQVNTYTTSSQSLASAAMDTAGDFVIAWASYGQDGDGRGIFAQRYDSAGNPVGGEFQVNTYTTNTQSNPSVAMDAAGNLVIAWDSLGQDGDDWGIYARIYGPDTEGPLTTNMIATPNPVPMGASFDVTATVDDTSTGGSDIYSAEWSLDGGANWDSMDAEDGTFDSPTEDVYETSTAGLSAVQEICARGTDVEGNTGTDECFFLVIYDPSAGFVSGGGWFVSPVGAYTADTLLTGNATFGFISKYKKGSEVPTGQTEFQFKVADLNFHSSSYDWLVVSGKNYAMFKGEGTINGEGNYKFMLWAGDDDPDTFRIKIWDEDEFTAEETVIYDNGFDQEISGGSIVIHSK